VGKRITEKFLLSSSAGRGLLSCAESLDTSKYIYKRHQQENIHIAGQSTGVCLSKRGANSQISSFFFSFDVWNSWIGLPSECHSSGESVLS
jgi:hypothetical protein